MEPRRAKPWWNVLKFALRGAILLAVALGVWGAVDKALREFDQRNFSLTQARPEWLLASAACFFAGTLPNWLFWRRVLLRLEQRPRWFESFRAYYVSQIGKYVPGKALVVVMRSDMIRGPRVDGAIAAAATFVETLTLMAVGACLAAVILAVWFRQEPRLLALAVGLALAAGVPSAPPIFRRLARWLQARRASANIDSALERLDARLMLRGWLEMTLGWALMGLSLWCVTRALPPALLAAPANLSLATELPLLTACAALAVVAGFVSLLPGGVGVREFVVMTLLAPTHGAQAAVLAALLARFTWLVAEVALSGMLCVGWRRAAENGRAASPENADAAKNAGPAEATTTPSPSDGLEIPTNEPGVRSEAH